MNSVLIQYLNQFRQRYPYGVFATERLPDKEGLYAVKAILSAGTLVIATAMALDDTLESAEDRALQRVCALAGIELETPIIEPELPSNGTRFTKNNGHLPVAMTSLPVEVMELYEEERTALPRREQPARLAPPAPYSDSYEEEEGPIDLSDLIAQTGVHLKRIGWDDQQGRAHLTRTYNKTSRKHLSGEELQDFLVYLKKLPSRRATAQDTPF